MFRFPRLSPGYAGIQGDSLTLNAQFIALGLESNLEVLKYSPTPQRIPRLGFFEELISAESPEFPAQLMRSRETAIRVLKELEAHSQRLPLVGADARFCNRVAGFLLRLGGSIESSPRFGDQDSLVLWQILLNDQQANIAASELAVNHDPSAVIQHAISVMEEETLSTYSRLISGTRAIVICMRHARESYTQYSKPLSKIASYMQLTVSKFSSDRFMDQIAVAMALRALPMLPIFTKHESKALIETSITTIRGMEASNESLVLIKQELLLTTILTQIKTLLQCGEDTSSVEAKFLDLEKLDPADSIVPSEFGLYLFKQERFAEAAKLFTRATELGPPCLALNYYYLGKCQEAEGRSSDALDSWTKCSQVDPLAVSPLIDSIFLYRERGELAPAREMRNLILKSDDLRSQLQESELEVLNAI